MNISAVGIKASVYNYRYGASIGAGASYSGTNLVLTSISSDAALTTNIEAIESDGASWTEIEEVGGANVRQNANDNPTIFAAGAMITSNYRIKNNGGAAVQIRIGYWTLI